MLSRGSQKMRQILPGASGWQMFRRVTLPISAGATLRRGVLTNARAIGEFGGVGGVRFRPAAKRYRYRYRLTTGAGTTTPSAFTAAALLTLMAILPCFEEHVAMASLENQKMQKRNRRGKS